uniref:BZIP domain-containing protein n=1 Tax=Panagrolaimus sp. JU765 TaxID=591449 RepID=A0AC34QY83_9BILA
MLEEECWNSTILPEDSFLETHDPTATFNQEMFTTREFVSDGISSCSSSLSSPGDSQGSNNSGSIHYLQDDLMSHPLADFDDPDCLTGIDDYDRNDGIAMEYEIKQDYYDTNDYIHDEASPSTKYVVLRNSNDSAFRPVATSLSFNRTPMKAVYPVRTTTTTYVCQPPTPSDDESKLSLPSLSRTRSKMHDLAVKNRLITDQNPKGHGVVQLSAEEKRTLLQEGYRLPTKLPLTREEEEALKLVRRKIKNKLSAQESRRKRKEYMDMLEQKVHTYYTENVNLKHRLKQIETANSELTKKIKELESRIQL